MVIIMDDKSLLEQLKKEEEELQFVSFSNDDAFVIGKSIYETAKKEKLPITIDITRSGQQLFHAALPGTSNDNDQWILRKIKVVNRFQMSSYHVGILLLSKGKSLEEQFNISSFEYAAHGGSFPIIIKNTGTIGTITVSGLAQQDDHAMVINVIRKFISSNVDNL